jgi:hypothetical protein
MKRLRSSDVVARHNAKTDGAKNPLFPMYCDVGCGNLPVPARLRASFS